MNFLKMIKTTKLNRFGDFIQANLTVVLKKVQNYVVNNVTSTRITEVQSAITFLLQSQKTKTNYTG